MKRYIHIRKQDRLKIAKAFSVTERTVFNAIIYDSERGNSDLARKIRKAAIECGGIPMVEAPEVETLHDNDNYIRQYMPNGVLLEMDKTAGTCDVWLRGEKVRRYENVAVSQINDIQCWAGALK